MMSAIFDHTTIYNEQFKFSLPQSFLEQYARGLGFDNKEEYTEEEKEALRFDIQKIWDQIQARKPSQSEAPTIVLTAGAPGAGKTTLLRRVWEKQPDFAYICPDDVCLKQMETTYGAYVAKTQDLKGGYFKWRAGSNYGHHLITAQLVKSKTNFMYGTTASSPQTALFLDFLRKNGYNIEILHVTAPDQVRWDSIAKRDQVFIQQSSQDVINKQLMVHERIQDTFLKYAHRICFYYRDGVDNTAIHAATWIRVDEDKGVLEIQDQKVFEEMKNLHNKVCDGMNKPHLKWENTVDKALL